MSKSMTLNAYIKAYCDNKYIIFAEKAKAFKHNLKWTAYHDIYTWYDTENDIVIEDRDYIGD